jgi:hypothetical protein
MALAIADREGPSSQWIWFSSFVCSGATEVATVPIDVCKVGHLVGVTLMHPRHARHWHHDSVARTHLAARHIVAPTTYPLAHRTHPLPLSNLVQSHVPVSHPSMHPPNLGLQYNSTATAMQSLPPTHQLDPLHTPGILLLAPFTHHCTIRMLTHQRRWRGIGPTPSPVFECRGCRGVHWGTAVQGDG